MNRKIENNEMDQLIREALESDASLRISAPFAEMAIQRLEKRALLRRLLLELFSKIGLVLITLIILLGVLAFVNGPAILTSIVDQILAYKGLLSAALIVIVATILIDQVVLKFYSNVSA